MSLTITQYLGPQLHFRYGERKLEVRDFHLLLSRIQETREITLMVAKLKSDVS
jgi:hypothetical protein